MASSAVTAQAPDYATAEAQYRAMLSRPSLNRCIEGRCLLDLLALTDDARAFAILSKDASSLKNRRTSCALRWSPMLAD